MRTEQEIIQAMRDGTITNKEVFQLTTVTEVRPGLLIITIKTPETN